MSLCPKRLNTALTKAVDFMDSEFWWATKVEYLRMNMQFQLINRQIIVYEIKIFDEQR